MRQRGVRGDDLDLSMATWVSDKLKTPGMARGILKPTGPEGTPSPGSTVAAWLAMWRRRATQHLSRIRFLAPDSVHGLPLVTPH